jgi:hypothetical protein
VDGTLAQAVYLGLGSTQPADDFTITDTLARSGPGVDTLTLVRGTTLIPGTPWTIAIREPGTVLPAPPAGPTQSGLPYTRVDMISANPPDDTIYIANHDFSGPGKYEVWYWGETSSDGKATASKRSIVYVDQPGNQPPAAVALVLPQDGEKGIGTSPSLLDWSQATDADGDAVTYELIISTSSASDSNGVLSSSVYRRADIQSSQLLLGADAGLQPGVTYYWQVRAFDRWGLWTLSPVWGFSDDVPDRPLFFPIFGKISSRDRTGVTSGLQGAAINWNGGTQPAYSGPDGNFFLSVPPLADTSCTSGARFVGTVTANNGSDIPVPIQINKDFCSEYQVEGEANFTLEIDTDGDGLSDIDEVVYGTDPDKPDSDGDTLSDFDEVNYDGNPAYNPSTDLDPNARDTDSDGADDNVEIAAGTNPLDGNDFPVTADGDLNDDGVVNAIDVLWGFQVLTGQRTLTQAQFDRGDVAGSGGALPSPDGVFDLGDALVIQRKALGLVNF